MTVASRLPRNLKTETDVAVLQVQVGNVEEKLNEIKDEFKTDIQSLRHSIEQNAAETRETLAESARAAEDAHKELSRKISSLEKWRWMLMGAGVVIGSMGFKTLSELLK
jgi:hypothetical protein